MTTNHQMRVVVLQGQADDVASEINELIRRFSDIVSFPLAKREQSAAGKKYSTTLYVTFTFMVDAQNLAIFDRRIFKFYKDMGYDDYEPFDPSLKPPEEESE